MVLNPSFFKANNLSLEKESYFMSVVQGYLSKKKKKKLLDFVRPWFRVCPRRAAGGFPGQGWSELPEPWVGGGTRGNSRLSWPGDGVHSLCCKLRSVEMLLSPAAGVFMSLLAFIVCFFPLPSFWFFIVLSPNQTNSFIFIFSSDFSAENDPSRTLLGS